MCTTEPLHAPLRERRPKFNHARGIIRPVHKNLQQRHLSFSRGLSWFSQSAVLGHDREERTLCCIKSDLKGLPDMHDSRQAYSCCSTRQPKRAECCSHSRDLRRMSRTACDQTADPLRNQGKARQCQTNAKATACVNIRACEVGFRSIIFTTATTVCVGVKTSKVSYQKSLYQKSLLFVSSSSVSLPVRLILDYSTSLRQTFQKSWGISIR